MTLDLSKLDPARLADLSPEQFTELMQIALTEQQQDRRENQILYYRLTQPASLEVLQSEAHMIAAFGGNRSSKTTTCMVRNIALATGMIPKDPVVHAALRPKFKGPLRGRMVVESITTTLHPIILPKLQWFSWSGMPPAGGEKGHWGWIPRSCLIDGEWTKSWSEKLRTLTVLCRDPDRPEKVLGKSTIQFMSFDQDWSDFASGDFDWIHEDEPPPHSIHRENQARVMSVGGTMFLSMTWPDDPSIPVDWIFDEIYEKGTPGPDRDPDIDVIELDTLQNPFLDQAGIAAQAAKWDAATRATRIAGKPLRFSNRIHPLFTDTPMHWSFAAGKVITPGPGGICPETGSFQVVEFCHVEEFDHSRNWPVIFLIDPHPRKPHMMTWAQITPGDDIDFIATLELAGDCTEVFEAVTALEREMGLQVARRLGDPNMLQSPAAASRNREATWLREFADAGLVIELADDGDVGRSRLNTYLQPDPHTWRPRVRWHRRCTQAIYQIKRFVWEDFKRKDEKDVKNKPRAKYDDHPAMARYLLNANLDFRTLAHGAPVLHTGRFSGPKGR
jgi:hypothetical protein